MRASILRFNTNQLVALQSNEKKSVMTSLKIRTYTGGNTEPDNTVTIPLNVLNVAAKLIPKRAAAHLKQEGIDLEEIVEISGSSDVRGILLEAEDHIENKKVVIAIE